MNWIRLLAAIILAAIAAAAVWWLADRPQEVAAEWRQPLASLSFAPYRRGLSPLTRHYASSAQIEEDMRTLVGRSLGIRTYTTRENLQVVPELAEKLGLKVTMGAWLGREPAINEAEIESLIAAANAHPETIQRVIVGNEVLLRRDLPPDQLIATIRRVKAAIKQPVSYADVWAFYLRYPEVVQELDFLTIHILPFWEDEPIGIEHAEQHIVEVVEQIRRNFPGKPILIGEAGWPSMGRDRGPAVVNLVNEARFVRQLPAIAKSHDFDYNIVEAFDQPWKSALENTVGAAWGILDEYRQPKFPMTGPVEEIADWRQRALCALALGALATILFGRRIGGFGGLLFFAVAAQILSWLLVTTLYHCAAVTFRSWQYLWLPLRLGPPLLLFVTWLRRYRDWLLDPRLALQGGAGAFFGKASFLPAQWWKGESWAVLSAFYAVAWTGLLAGGGRYRDIPEIDFSVPVAGLALAVGLRLALAWRQGASLRSALSYDGLLPGHASRAIRLLAWLLPLSAVVALGSEGVSLMLGEDFIRAHPTIAAQIPFVLKGLIWNREMDLWAAMLLLWSVPLLVARRPDGDSVAGGPAV